MRAHFVRDHVGEDDRDARAVELVEALKRAVAQVAAKLVEDARIERDEANFVGGDGRNQLLLGLDRHCQNSAMSAGRPSKA